MLRPIAFGPRRRGDPCATQRTTRDQADARIVLVLVDFAPLKSYSNAHSRTHQSICGVPESSS
jgi:hypothetical protein